MDRCRRLAERLYNIENPVGPQPSTNRSQPSSAADPTLAAIIIFLNRSDANLARRAKSLLSSFFFCARTDLFLGRLRAPPDGFNNPPDTWNRPGERFGRIVEGCWSTVERKKDARKRVPPRKESINGRDAVYPTQPSGTEGYARSAMAIKPRRVARRPSRAGSLTSAVKEAVDRVTQTLPIDWFGEMFGETGGFGGGDVAIGSESAQRD